MMHRLSNPVPWLIGALLLAIAAAYLWFSGSAVVVDETGTVESAVVTNSHGTEQPLYELWDGYFYAVPKIEGTIEVRCTNGERKQWGYVTPHMHSKIRVEGDAPCDRVVHAD